MGCVQHFNLHVHGVCQLSKQFFRNDLYTDKLIKKKKQIYRMFVRGGNCVRMDMGTFLSSKIVTVTDACAE